MGSFLDKIKKSAAFQDKTTRNISLVASGVIFELISNGVSYLILTRLYSPSEFGIFISFLSIGTLLLILSTLKYDWFIPNARGDSEAINIFFLCVLTITFVAMLLTIPLFKLFLEIFENSEISKIKEHIWLAPFYVFFGGLYQASNMWAVRKKYFLAITKAKFYQSISILVVSIGLGLLKFGVSGLILANVVSLFSGTTNFAYFFLRRDNEKLKEINLGCIFSYAKRYFKLSITSLGQSLINIFSFQIVPVILTAYFGPRISGQYFLAERMINLPNIIIGQATLQVFWSEASYIKQENPGKLRSLYINFFKKLAKLSWTIVAIGILGPFTFEFIFGSKDWGEAGLFALILVPSVVCQFCIFHISSTILIVSENQHWLLMWDMLRLILTFSCFYIPHNLVWKAHYATLLYSSIMTSMYIILFFISMLAIRRAEKK